MRRRLLLLLVTAAAPIVALTLQSAPTQADPGVLVYPGMEIIQGTTVCTLGYVDPQARTAFTAGHCRGNGMVRDKDGHFVGNQALFRDNTPDGTTIDTNHQIADWEAISLAPDVAGERHSSGRTAAGPGSRHRACAGPGGLPLRCDHGRELRDHPGGVQRLVHDGQWRGEREGRLRRARSTCSPPTAGQRSSGCSTAPGGSTRPRCPGRPPASRPARTSSPPRPEASPLRRQCPSEAARTPESTWLWHEFRRRPIAA